MLYVVIFFIVAAVMLMISKVILSASLKRQDESMLQISIIWLVFKWRREINLSDYSSMLLKGREPEAPKKDAVNLISGLKDIRALYCAKTKSVRKAARFIQKHLMVNELNAQIEAGGSDACIIAVKTGLIYSFTGIIDSLLTGIFKINEKSIFIQPNFSSKKTRMHLSCILKMRYVNIIIAVSWVNFIYQKFKREERRCVHCHIRSKD